MSSSSSSSSGEESNASSNESSSSSNVSVPLAPNNERRRRKRRETGKDKVTGASLKEFPDGLNPSARRNEWILWKERLLLLVALKPSLKTQEDKKAFLIVSGGREIQKALNDKPVATEVMQGESIPVFENALKRLDHHFQTGTNALTDIIRFRKIKQKKGEQFIDFVQRLQQHASHCGFGESEENEILLQIRTGAIHATKLSEMMTRENKSLADVVNYGSCLDNEEAMAETKLKEEKARESDDKEEGSNVAFVQRSDEQGRGYGNRFRPYHDNQRARGRGRGRGRELGRGFQTKVRCYNCKKVGHFARDCYARPNETKRQVNAVYKDDKSWDLN